MRTPVAPRGVSPGLVARLRRRRRAILPVIVVLVALLTGCSTPPAPTVTPYVDVTSDTFDLVDAVDATGVQRAVLSFVLATGGTCTPSWGGIRPLDDPALQAQEAALRERGVDLVVASGGAEGEYLEQACESPEALAGAYRAALDATGARSLDVDVESGIEADRVVAALAELQRERGTEVTLTLRVVDADTGLEPVALDLVRRSVAAGVAVTVNPMVMNFPYTGGWGDAMVAAVDTVAGQLAEVRPGWTATDPTLALGATVMIGRTDLGAVTTLDDATTVRDHARAIGLTRLGLWSLARDNGRCPGRAVAAPDCSGVAQPDFAFTTLLDGSDR